LSCTNKICSNLYGSKLERFPLAIKAAEENRHSIGTEDAIPRYSSASWHNRTRWACCYWTVTTDHSSTEECSQQSLRCCIVLVELGTQRILNSAGKIFGWLRNITNSAGIRLSRKKFGSGAAHVKIIRRGGAWRRRRGLPPLTKSMGWL